MAHEYEYVSLINYLEPVKLGGSSSFKDEPARQALAKSLGNYTSDIPNMLNRLPDNRGWEINSHSITFQDGVAVVSILLQRHCK